MRTSCPPPSKPSCASDRARLAQWLTPSIDRSSPDRTLTRAGPVVRGISWARRISVGLLALVLLTAPAGLAGAELTCASAESMDGLMQAWTAGFTAQHPETPARVTLRAKFSADFTEPLGRGEIKVAPYARELFGSERERLTQLAGGAPRLVPVATGSRATKGGTHAIVIFVNEKNPLARISLAQLREVFAGDGRITTWGQLGLTGEWAARKITLHGMKTRRETGNPPGIVNFLETRLLPGHVWRADVHEYTDQPGLQSLEQITRAVAADESALGYSGFAYAVSGAKALALGETEAGPFYAGTDQEIAGRQYPLVRTIYLVTGPAPDEVTRSFVDYVLSPAGQQIIAADTQKFFPLPPARSPSPARP
jgi:phosphate transport system substrate-binding protein